MTERSLALVLFGVLIVLDIWRRKDAGEFDPRIPTVQGDVQGATKRNARK